METNFINFLFASYRLPSHKDYCIPLFFCDFLFPIRPNKLEGFIECVAIPQNNRETALVVPSPDRSWERVVFSSIFLKVLFLYVWIDVRTGAVACVEAQGYLCISRVRWPPLWVWVSGMRLRLMVFPSRRFYPLSTQPARKVYPETLWRAGGRAGRLHRLL